MHQKNFEEIFEHAPNGMALVALDGRFLHVNRALCDLVGYTSNELTALTFQQITHPDDVDEDVAQAQALLAGQNERYRMEKRYVTKGGQHVRIILYASVIRDGAGVPQHFVAQIEDVTERRRAEEERDQYFMCSLDLMCVATFDGRFKRVNPAWTTALGWSAEELCERPFLHFVHPLDKEKTVAESAKLSGGGKSTHFENRYRCKDDTYRWLQWRATGSMSDGCIFALARDVTELKSQQQRMILNDRMASVGTLSAGIAHELNTPLAAIMTNLELARDELKDMMRTPNVCEIDDALRDAAEGARRARGIVRQLRVFSRAEREQRTVVPLARVVEQAIDLAAGELRSRGRIVKDLDAKLFVNADEGRLTQVFINLIRNAAQALPERAVEDNEVRVRCYPDDDGRPVVEVIDNGDGIAENVLPRIFEPFYTTKDVTRFPGMGLATCHAIVTGLGGEITVESSECGTVARVALPSSSFAAEA